MIRLISLTLVLTVATNLNAACFGSQNFYSCNDSSGNNYNIQKVGNQTNMQGYNQNTGSTWNQTSNTIGNATYQNGTDSHGNTWNQTIQKLGNTTTYSGSDSQGNTFYKTCNQFGCF